MLHIKVNDALRRCEIWVPSEQRTAYKASEEYQKAVETYKRLGYQVTIFIGGNAPLLPTITNLLEAQAEPGLPRLT